MLFDTNKLTIDPSMVTGTRTCSKMEVWIYLKHWQHEKLRVKSVERTVERVCLVAVSTLLRRVSFLGPLRLLDP